MREREIVKDVNKKGITMKNATRWKSWNAIVVGFVAVTLGGFWSKGWSEDLPPPGAAPVSTVSAADATASTASSPGDLEQRLRVLERKLEVFQEDQTAKAKESPVVTAGKEGFQLQSPDKNFVLKIRALLQADARFFTSDPAGNLTNQFLVRRARPILEGTVYQFYSFRVTPDFASNGKTELFDAYVDIAPWTFAKLRVGKFKPPIGLEHLQSDEYVAFAERGFTSLLVPSRDTGVQLFGDLGKGVLSYAAAFTNGVGDNNVNAATTAPVTSDTDNTDSKEGTARLVVTPFRNTSVAAVQNIGIGFGASYAKENVLNPTYLTPGQVSIFSLLAPATSGPAPDGEKIRLEPDLSYYYHSFGATGEWVQSSQVYRVGSVKSRIVNQAWQVVTRYVLTGEDTSYNGVRPRATFDPQKGTWGAFELVSRYGELYLDPDNFTQNIADPKTSIQRGSQWGLGLNWYLNSSIRFVTDYDQTTFDKGASAGSTFADRPNEKIIISRWQLLF